MRIGIIRYPQKLYSTGKVIRGGSEIANQYIIDYLRKNNQTVIEFEPKSEARLKLIDIPALGTPLMFQDLLSQMDEINRCDVILTTNWFGSIFPEIKKPLITIFHHDAKLVLRFSTIDAVKDRKIFYKWLNILNRYSIGMTSQQMLHDNIIAIGEQELAKQSVKNIIVSKFLKDNLISDYKIDPNKTEVIFNSFPEEWDRGDIKKDFKVDKLNLTCVTRLPIDEAGIIVKGIDQLFQVLNEEKYTNKTLVASTRGGLYRKFFDENLTHVNYFENANRQEVASHLEKAHLTLHLSRCESFGLSIAESMIMGNIPIIFPTGVAEELVVDGKNGFLVKDYKEVLNLIKKLNVNREMLKDISVQARQTILRTMSPQIIGEKYLKTIKEIV